MRRSSRFPAAWGCLGISIDLDRRSTTNFGRSGLMKTFMVSRDHALARPEWVDARLML
jgi:hypothetical protein